ncbi:MAG: rod shape-determining protein MreD [Candidatus Omnitrophica bacterium]|nr:rod shape-determining protein MreD [Candidatus Omnitrophota bacterium]
MSNIKRYALIFLLAAGFYAGEVFVFGLSEGRFTAHLMLAYIILLGLYLDFRYCFFAAVTSGIFKDSLLTSLSGINTLSFLSCAGLLFILRKYFYHPHSGFSRVWTVFLVLCFNELINFVFYSYLKDISFPEAFRYAIAPNIVLALFFYKPVKYVLEKCVLR